MVFSSQLNEGLPAPGHQLDRVRAFTQTPQTHHMLALLFTALSRRVRFLLRLCRGQSSGKRKCLFLRHLKVSVSRGFFYSVPGPEPVALWATAVTLTSSTWRLLASAAAHHRGGPQGITEEGHRGSIAGEFTAGQAV